MRTKFFTGEGDRGDSKIGGKKISKSNKLIDLLGGLDELNSWVGFCRVEAENNFSKKGLIDISSVVGQIQESLFVIQAEVAALGFGPPAGGSKSPKISEDKTQYLETIIKEIDSVVPKIEKFIIVGGSELSARLDVARAIARRTERQAKKYSEEKQLREPVLKFLNRLSSILFALARYVNHELGIQEKHPSY